MTDFEICAGGATRCGPDWHSVGWLPQPEHKLYIISSGTARYAIPGQEVALRPERLYLIPGGGRHRYGPAADMQVHWLHLRILSPAVEQQMAGRARIQEWPLGDWRWWQPVWESIPSWLQQRDLAGELRLQALLAMVLGAAIANAVPKNQLDPRLDAAVRWMDAQCCRHPSLEAAARIAGLAPAVFHRRFSAAVGCTPRSWLESRRLDHARRLLRQDGSSVQDVAAACGYANPFHFSRVMRRRLGGSPQQLRARWAAGTP